jgi:UDP-N-acetylglucosamine--N-acetylmuramyl-(pentapeptide) pyrophosphoryl-undecaprenol N-acetylglucosamine transferase
MQERESVRLLITGGGTGGHLFPAVAFAEAVTARFPSSSIMFVGTRRKMDRTTLENLGFAIRTVHCKGLKGKNLIDALAAMLLLPVTIVESLVVLLRFKPELVFGVGGYVTGPVILAARMLGIPACIHEQNSIPGLANRLLGRIVNRIFISIPGSEKFFPPGKTIYSGNPVRSSIVRAGQKKKTSNSDSFTVLVLGGSQGAHRINTLVPECVTLFSAEQLQGLRIIHQTGSRDEEQVRKAYENMQVKAEAAAFYTDMASLYKQADLVISRAGATTIAELMAMGKAALLIPFPYAADNHQEANGKCLVEKNAARMFLEQELTAERLAEEIEYFRQHPDLLIEMGNNAADLAQPEAASVIIDECLQLIN